MQPEQAAVQLLKKFSATGAVVDANLLLLLLIGTYNVARIKSLMHTKGFSVEDFDLLVNLLRLVRRRITTPHIMTEVDNLSRKLPEKDHAKLSGTFVKLCTDQFEIYSESIVSLRDKLHPVLGITDCHLLRLAANEGHLIITADWPLANRLETANLSVINFNHLRVV